MGAYVTRRVILALFVLWLVTVGTFSMVRLLPGSALDQLYLDAVARQKNKDELRHQLGLDRPIHIQYVNWVGGIFQGDFGDSILTGRPVISRIKERLPVSFELGIIALLISIPLGVSIGIMSAVRQGTFLDYLGRSVAVGGLSFPDFFIGTLIILYAALWFDYGVPLVYEPFWKDLGANAQQILIPAAILGFRQSAGTMRITRSAMLEVLRQDYIRTAWSKGLREGVVVSRHAVKNALIPVVTVIGSQLSLLIGGTVIMETLFSLPGMGRLAIDAINQRDYPQVQAVVLLMAAFVVFVNLAVDVLYSYLDPRIRYSR